MKLFKEQLKFSSLIIFFSQLSILLKYAFTQEYTYCSDDVVQVSTLQSLSANQNLTYNYLLQKCQSQDRKVLIGTRLLDLQIDNRVNKYIIEQIQQTNSNGVQFFITEICMKEVYVQSETINTANKNLLTSTFISKPVKFNQSMKAFPFIIGHEMPQGVKSNSIFIEKCETGSDGFVFTFNSSYPETVTSVSINYLYYDPNSLNKYYKLDQYLENKYKNVSSQIYQGHSFSVTVTKTPFQCASNDAVKCKIFIGFQGYDLMSDGSGGTGIRAKYQFAAINQNFGLTYEVWANSKGNGMTTQTIMFEMMRCKTNSNSQKINYKDSCVEKCPDGEYQDNDANRNIFICLKCSSTCKTCITQQQCLSCTQNQYLYNYECSNAQPSTTYCLNKDDYYNCFKCPDNCTSCTQTECSSCVDNYYLFNKICNLNQPTSADCKKNQNAYYTCIPCPAYCTQCNQNECSSCNPNHYLYKKTCYQTQPQYTYCQQEVDYKICIDCPKNCSTCIQSDCTSCLQPYTLFNKQCYVKCPNGYISDQQVCQTCTDQQMPICVSCYKTCLICDPFDVSQIPNSCTACSSTRQLMNGYCKCLDTEDSREQFFECSYEKIAVLKVTLSNTIPLLTIDFGKQLNIPNNFLLNQNSQSLCKQLFIIGTIELIGQSSQCSIIDKYIYVNLESIFFINLNSKNQDDKAEVFNGDVINLKQNILSFMTTSQIMIEKIRQTKLSFEYMSVENSCNDISIKFLKITNGAQRGIRWFSWSLSTYVPAQSTIQIVLQNFFIKANNEKKIDLIIPKGLIKSGAKVTIKIDFLLKANVLSYEELVLSTKSEKKITLDVNSPIINPFYKYQSGVILILLAVKVCDPSGDIEINEPIDFSITCSQFPQINYINSTYEQKDYTIELRPYTLSIGQIIININAKVSSDKFKEQNIDFELDVQSSKLLIKISGGNGQYNYKKEITISSNVRDFDMQSEKEPQGIDIQWKCKDSLTQSDCVDKNGNQVILPPQILTSKIEANTFNPYTVVYLTLTGKKDVRESSDSIMMFFQEFDLPPLEIQIDTQDNHKKTVNLNEEIIVNLLYDTSVNIDLLSYSGTISYKDEIVGIIKFDFPKLRFQIWNYFSGFQKELSSFQIRFSVFNPQYFIPSIFLSTFYINFPPNNCQLDVTPTIGGFSLETKFFIQFLDCIDGNQPIQYQFFYYKTVGDFEFEKKYPLQVMRRQLSDKQQTNYVESQLPSGDILVLAQAIDSKNAIYNNTIEVNIGLKQYDEQSYLSIIEQKLDSISQFPPTTMISDLSITCDEILKRQDFKSSSQLNSKKLQIINQLTFLQQSLPSYSTFSTVSNKAIASLSESGIIFEGSNQEELFDQLIKQLDASSNLQQSNLQVSQEKLKQKLYDSFQVVDSLSVSNSKQSSNSITNKVIELTEKISQNLFINILPNEEPIIYYGKQMNLLGTQITEKYICSYFLCNTNRLLANSKQTTIYNFKKSEYQNNPYSEDESFKNYTDTLKKLKSDSQILNFPVLSPAISSYENQPLETFPKQSILPFPSKKTNSDSKNMTCLTKNKNIGWTKNGCGQIFDDISQQFICFCKELSPTTIVEDLDELLYNENINTAFSSEGYLNIAKFKDFYKYSVFWLLVFFNLLFLKLFMTAKRLDFVDSFLKLEKIKNFKLSEHFSKQQTQYFKKNKVLPSFLNNILEKKNNQKQQNSYNNSTESILFSPKQTENNLFNSPLKSIFSRSKQPSEDLTAIDLGVNIQESQVEKKFEQINECSPQISLQIQSITTDKEIRTKVFDLNRIQSGNQRKNQTEKTKQIYDEQNTNIENQQQSIYETQKISDQKSDNTQKTQKCVLRKDNKRKESINTIISINENNQQEESQSQKPRVLNNLPFYKQILIFHNFFGIFYIYNPYVSRKLRFLIFYLRSIHSLGISIVFDKNYSLVQQIAIALFNSITILIVIKIIEFCYSFKSKFGKFISLITTASLFLGYYYIILSIVSGQTYEKSNEFFQTFLIFYLGDLLVFSIFFAFCARQIANFILHNQKVEGVSRYLYRLIQLQLVLVSIN